MLMLSFCSRAEPLRLVSSDYPPYFAAELPQQGPISEIIRQSFALQGEQITIDYMPFARAYREIHQGKFLGLIAAWYNEERANHFLYSLPIYNNDIVFFKRKNQPIKFQQFTDLQGFRLALVQGYLQPAGLLEASIETNTVVTDEQAFQMLVRGRVDLVPADKLTGLFLINNRMPTYAEQVEWIPPTIETQPLYLLLSKQHPAAEQLMQKFNAGLLTLQQTGHYQQILSTLPPAPTPP